MRYDLKDLSIDTSTRTVRRDGTGLKLPDLSFDVLVKLLEAAPKPVSVDELAHTVWRAEHVSDETIAQRIALLRKALGDSSKDPIYVRTVRGAGYAASAPTTSHENGHVRGVFPGLARRPAAFAASAISLLLAAFLFWNAGDNVSIGPEEPEAANSKTTVSILVERARAQLGLHQARETNRAIAMLREALEQDPEHFDGRMTLSFALSTKATKFGGDATVEQEAEAVARALIEERPDNSNAWSALAYALGSQGRVDESLHAYQYAFQLNPRNAPALSSAAHTLLLMGELHQALLLEARAKKAGGASRYAEIQIAQVLELIGHPATQKWYNEALTLNPAQVVILAVIARSHLRSGKPEDALKILDEAEGDDRSAPQILQLRGRAHTALGNFEAAYSAFEAAGFNAHYDMAALQALSGDRSVADALLEPAKLSKLDADADAESRVQYAEIAAALGHNMDALRFLSQAVNLGWRDTDWLKQSPYLGDLMTLPEGLLLEARIAREIETQRKLIEGSEELTVMLDS